MPRGRPKQGSCTRYIHVIIKKVTHGRWEQAKKRLVTKTDDGLANFLLDLYLNDSPSLPRNDEQCNIEVVTFETCTVEQFRCHYLVYGTRVSIVLCHNYIIIYVYIRNQLKWFL